MLLATGGITRVVAITERAAVAMVFATPVTHLPFSIFVTLPVTVPFLPHRLGCATSDFLLLCPRSFCGGSRPFIPLYTRIQRFFQYHHMPWSTRNTFSPIQWPRVWGRGTNFHHFRGTLSHPGKLPLYQKDFILLLLPLFFR